MTIIFSVVYIGMKVAYKMFPEGLITGSPPPVVSETPRPPTEMHMAEKSQFDQSDMDNLNVYLDSQLMDKSSGSKCFFSHTRSGFLLFLAHLSRRLFSSPEQKAPR